MKRGRRPNLKRRLEIAKLRAKGLTYHQIGQRLGVSRQCVHTLLRSTDEGLTYTACCACGHRIARWRGPRPHPVFCPSCLPADASVAQKIQSYRVALGLTQRALAARAGIPIGSIKAYERGQRPGPRNGAKLGKVLGIEVPALSRDGNAPDLERRRQVVELRSKGLTLQQIADQLGISNQRVHQILVAELRARKENSQNVRDDH